MKREIRLQIDYDHVQDFQEIKKITGIQLQRLYDDALKLGLEKLKIKYL